MYGAGAMQMKAKCCLTMEAGPAAPGMPGLSPGSV